MGYGHGVAPGAGEGHGEGHGYSSCASLGPVVGRAPGILGLEGLVLVKVGGVEPWDENVRSHWWWPRWDEEAPAQVKHWIY